MDELKRINNLKQYLKNHGIASDYFRRPDESLGLYLSEKDKEDLFSKLTEEEKANIKRRSSYDIYFNLSDNKVHIWAYDYDYHNNVSCSDYVVKLNIMRQVNEEVRKYIIDNVESKLYQKAYKRHESDFIRKMISESLEIELEQIEKG